MPLPKDPEKLKAYKERMRQLALERGFGKSRKGQKVSDETKQKMSQSQIERAANPDERKRRSETAKANGCGKWMKGRDTSHYKRQSRKGKTYEEIYGKERAEEEKQKRVEANRIAKLGADVSHLIKAGKKHTDFRKGKTYQQIYGENAESELEKRRTTMRAKAEKIPKRERNLEKHKSDFRYTDWRNAVFNRDNYTCQDCQQHGGQLEAHHLKSWAKFPELRYELSNGQTLCKTCHKIANKKQKIEEKINVHNQEIVPV